MKISDQNSATTAAPGGKRAANKVDKLARIKRAAFELFVVRGYDNTTMRDIAAMAEVAQGTVFTYASNKRDLLFVVANDLLDTTRQRAERSIRSDRSLLENFVVFSAFHYQTFGMEPTMSRLILRELLFYDSGRQAVHALENRKLLWKNLETMIRLAHDGGQIELPVKAETVALALFGTLQAELRRWLALPEQDIFDGLKDLWTSASLIVNGIRKEKVAFKVSKVELRTLLRTAGITSAAASSPARLAQEFGTSTRATGHP